MAFWSGLFKSREDFAKEAEALLLDECETLVRVVGESHYQPALRSICGAAEWEEVSFDCIAVLVPDPSNPYDEMAVMVQIDASLVGHLSREDARAYRPMIDQV